MSPVSITTTSYPTSLMLSKASIRALAWTPLLDISSTSFPLRLCHHSLHQCSRRSGSSSSKRWQNRQGRDRFSREARVQGLKSRAAFKLLELDSKHRLFKKGQTVVDLGYAPGSWSQVAVDRTAPNGRVVGIDVIPALPPRGVSTIQGDFLSPQVQKAVKRFVRDPRRGRPISQTPFFHDDDEESSDYHDNVVAAQADPSSSVDLERRLPSTPGEDEVAEGLADGEDISAPGARGRPVQAQDVAAGRVVDVVLSDMCAPWPLTTGFWKRGLSDPYYRMMNTSGMSFRDHAGSMDLCAAALAFAYDTLRAGGHLVCKFYQGAEDRALEARLRRLFAAVHREKPESSRSDSKEAYFVALRRKDGVDRADVVVDS